MDGAKLCLFWRFLVLDAHRFGESSVLISGTSVRLDLVGFKIILTETFQLDVRTLHCRNMRTMERIRPGRFAGIEALNPQLGTSYRKWKQKEAFGRVLGNLRSFFSRVVLR